MPAITGLPTPLLGQCNVTGKFPICGPNVTAAIASVNGNTPLKAVKTRYRARSSRGVSCRRGAIPKPGGGSTLGSGTMAVMAQPRAAFRLAELVAALSLGIDLGFGQPMEHVLRQCLIAMRLAERMGLDNDARSAVYYTALLVNVGCHSDAHEQAKWFGDDIELKSHKYDYDQHSLVAVAASMRRLGQGHPPVHRF